MTDVEGLVEIYHCNIEGALYLRVKPDHVVQKSCKVRGSAVLSEAVLVLRQANDETFSSFNAFREDFSEY